MSQRALKTVHILIIFNICVVVSKVKVLQIKSTGSKTIDNMEYKSETSPWLWFLLLITLVQTSLFAVVTLYQYDNTVILQEEDIDLDIKIKHLQALLDSDNKKLHKQKRAGNFIADILTAQEAVIAQHCIEKNKTCIKGDAGDPGLPGNIGDKGEKGIPGDAGFPGKIGDKGESGVRGGQGEQGIKGAIGPKGFKGIQGDIGPRGAKGDLGPRGSKGDSGVKGEKGETGEKGIPGPKGTEGSSGEKGDLGDKGGRGLKGNKGEQGPQGPTGPDNVKDGCACLEYPKFEDPTPSTTFYLSVGESRNLPCNATGSPAPTVTLNKQIIVRRGVGSRDKRNLLKLNGKYTIMNAATSDFGTYVCTAKNSLGTITKLIDVKRGVLPNIAKQPRSSTNNAGTSADFRCVNSGIPTPTVTWYKDGKLLVPDPRYQISSNGEVLTIINVRASDAGRIECRVANEVGTATSREAVLTVV
ncbi:hemicentin-2-like [Saccostrea echinata]|uniref:hemicentin-2-like n=1 Tax=Saccostrea echinata TaxID=191078 RepID=UPI002A81F795|nr:hemicentin-2-like [Saccostrea echinata]